MFIVSVSSSSDIVAMSIGHFDGLFQMSALKS